MVSREPWAIEDVEAQSRERQLPLGDRIRVGEYDMRFEAPGAVTGIGRFRVPDSRVTTQVRLVSRHAGSIAPLEHLGRDGVLLSIPPSPREHASSHRWAGWVDNQIWSIDAVPNGRVLWRRSISGSV